jgi:hypothetical protein
MASPTAALETPERRVDFSFHFLVRSQKVKNSSPADKNALNLVS